MICFGIVITFAITLGMSETYKKTILQQRAKKLGIPGPEAPDRTFGQTVKFFATKTVTRPVHMLLTEPIVGLFDLYVAFNFGLLNAFFAAFSWVSKTPPSPPLTTDIPLRSSKTSTPSASAAPASPILGKQSAAFAASA